MIERELGVAPLPTPDRSPEAAEESPAKDTNPSHSISPHIAAVRKLWSIVAGTRRDCWNCHSHNHLRAHASTGPESAAWFQLDSI